MAKRLFWALVVLATLLVVAILWFGLSTDAKISGLRNILLYKATQLLGGVGVRTGEPSGALSGIVRDGEGQPLVGATVLIASPLGDTYAAESDSDGRFLIPDVPPGSYVPVAGRRGYADALPQRCLAGLCDRQPERVQASHETGGVTLWLETAAPPQIAVDQSLIVSPTTEVESLAPLPGRALRTHLSFERAGLRVNDCWLYEPLQGEGPFPTLLLVLPGPVLGWEIVPVPFAAEDFSVLACYPLRGTNIDQDAADLLSALEYVRQGRLPSRADPERLGLVSASFTSLHSYRLLGQTDQVDVALVLGGLADAFAFRRDVETGAAHTRPPFDQILMALGFPNHHPEQYFRYSVLYHLEGMPPLCLLHGLDDELVPYNQSVILDHELTQRGLPHEFHHYEGLKHYFSTDADNATTQQMFQDSLACLRRWLAGE